MRSLGAGTRRLGRGGRLVLRLPLLALSFQAHVCVPAVGLRHCLRSPVGRGLACRTWGPRRRCHSAPAPHPAFPSWLPGLSFGSRLTSEPWTSLSTSGPRRSSPCRSPGLRPGPGCTFAARALSWPLPDLGPAPAPALLWPGSAQGLALTWQVFLEPSSSPRSFSGAPPHLCTEPLKL